MNTLLLLLSLYKQLQVLENELAAIQSSTVAVVSSTPPIAFAPWTPPASSTYHWTPPTPSVAPVTLGAAQPEIVATSSPIQVPWSQAHTLIQNKADGSSTLFYGQSSGLLLDSVTLTIGSTTYDLPLVQQIPTPNVPGTGGSHISFDVPLDPTVSYPYTIQVNFGNSFSTMTSQTPY